MQIEWLDERRINLKFGIHNPSWKFNSGSSSIFTEVKDKAQFCEEYGFSWFSVMDHFIQIGGVGPPEDPMMESWTLIAALAAVTSNIRIGTLVSSVGYRNPALLAKMAAGVDIISQGRLTLGIGAGWFKKEYEQYGYTYPVQPSTRIHQLEEAVRLIKTMWEKGRATFNGKYYRIENAILEPKPIQKPHPPIMIGGGGEKLTLRVVARVGDATNVFGNPDGVRRKYEILRQHCEAEGRDYQDIERTNLTDLLLASDEVSLKRKREKYSVPEDHWGLVLTVDQAVDRLESYRQAGVQLFICSVHQNDRESLELLAGEVMPHF
jgi:F420-dependent oxidoreductase-like protein